MVTSNGVTELFTTIWLFDTVRTIEDRFYYANTQGEGVTWIVTVDDGATYTYSGTWWFSDGASIAEGELCPTCSGTSLSVDDGVWHAGNGTINGNDQNGAGGSFGVGNLNTDDTACGNVYMGTTASYTPYQYMRNYMYVGSSPTSTPTWTHAPTTASPTAPTPSPSALPTLPPTALNATLCRGDVTVLSSNVLLCNEVTQVSARDLVEVTGDVRLASLAASITSVSLPNLAVIGQDLYVSDIETTTTILSFPSLVSVYGSVYFNYVETETIELPLLQNVTGDVNFYSWIEAHSLKLPSLRWVGGYFYVGGYASTVDVGNLESVGSYFMLDYNLYLDTVNVSSLQAVGYYMRITQSRYYLTELSFGSLAYVGGYLYLTDNDALTTAFFNSLTSIESTTYCGVSGDYENVCVDANNALESIAFRSLDYDSVDVAVSSGMCKLRPFDHFTLAQKVA